MIFKCDASRVAIYISLGHRNNSFFFLEFKKKNVIRFDPVGQQIQKLVKNQQNKLATSSAESSWKSKWPFFRPMFCRAGFTEYYVLPRG